MSEPAAELVRDITILAIYDNGDERPVEGNLVTLRGLQKLRFRIEFDEEMTDNRFWVTVVIRRRGKTDTTPGDRQNEFRHSRSATSFRRTYDVQGDPPWLEFDVEDHEPPEFHDGPGPYETAVALTPTGEGDTPDEENTSSLSYDFVGVP